MNLIFPDGLRNGMAGLATTGRSLELGTSGALPSASSMPQSLISDVNSVPTVQHVDGNVGGYNLLIFSLTELTTHYSFIGIAHDFASYSL